MPKPLIVIVGPTASGKTELAIRLAKKYGGEIICADSRTVYKGLDIGTAKPSEAQQAEVVHHLLDVVQPDEVFTAADFQARCVYCIQRIHVGNKIPFLVGGSGLYVDSVVYSYNFNQQSDPLERNELEIMRVDELQINCIKNNVELPHNNKNKRYLIRALQQGGINQSRSKTPLLGSIVVGISTENKVLKARIADRASDQFIDTAITEAMYVATTYGWDSPAMTGNIYKLIRRYIAGEFSKQDLKQKFITADWQLVRKQRTWFTRNPDIHWASLTDAEQLISAHLDDALKPKT